MPSLPERGSCADADFCDTLFSPIDLSGGALVAISGGSDSTALLLLLKQYLNRCAPTAPLVAVTVDHGLRSGSAAEARAVAALCAHQGISHKTLAWTGAKPSTGLPAAAREVRYRLLAEAAQSAGIGLILTGHTADDQVETVLMRQTRTEQGAQPGRGLAGMAPATLYDWKTWIVRPLIGARREALRDYLRRHEVGWADDPTNTDHDFERPRIRAELHERPDARHFGVTITLAADAATQREAVASRAAQLVRTYASQPAPGLLRLDPGFATVADRAAAVEALRVLLATAGGVGFPPDDARTSALLDQLAAGPLRATLARTVVDARRAGIFLLREFRDLPEPSLSADGMIWDGRLRINFRDDPGASVIAPLGTDAAAKSPAPQNDAPPSLVRAAHAAEPALWRDGECLGALALNAGDNAVFSIVAPFARFLPAFDLPLAAALGALVGAPSLPLSPLRAQTAGDTVVKA